MADVSDGVYFAQITDIHVGNNNLNGEAARRHLRVRLDHAVTSEGWAS